MSLVRGGPAKMFSEIFNMPLKTFLAPLILLPSLLRKEIQMRKKWENSSFVDVLCFISVCYVVENLIRVVSLIRKHIKFRIASLGRTAATRYNEH
jgi:hypothetical protein